MLQNAHPRHVGPDPVQQQVDNSEQLFPLNRKFHPESPVVVGNSAHLEEAEGLEVGRERGEEERGFGGGCEPQCGLRSPVRVGVGRKLSCAGWWAVLWWCGLFGGWVLAGMLARWGSFWMRWRRREL